MSSTGRNEERVGLVLRSRTSMDTILSDGYKWEEAARKGMKKSC